MASVVLRLVTPKRTAATPGGGLASGAGAVAVPWYGQKRKGATVVSGRIKVGVEERYNIRFERNASEQRLRELGVQEWSHWETWGKCKLRWEWHVDQIVYIVKGAVRVVPDGCPDAAWFYAGDLVRYPKWLSAALYFQGPYQEKYRFLAYGDNDMI